ncbi:MAG: hypothetical protein HUU29_05570 [Planctomycetaceae bacterium]|nr:hypothetical protein [Planctomycetaceae bacterium]
MKPTRCLSLFFLLFAIGCAEAQRPAGAGGDDAPTPTTNEAPTSSETPKPAEQSANTAQPTLGAEVFCKAAQGRDLPGVVRLIRALEWDDKRVGYIAKSLALNNGTAFVEVWKKGDADFAAFVLANGISESDLQRATGYVLMFEKVDAAIVTAKLKDIVGEKELQALVAKPYARDVVALPQNIAMTGKLEKRDNIDFLTVKGSAAERGYAHGKLLGSSIVKLLQQVSKDLVYLMSAGKNYEQIRVLQYTSFDFTADEMTEMAAMLRGIEETVPEAERKIGDRFIDLVDLQACNTVADWVRFGCSSCSIFGKLAPEEGPVVIRNLDYLVDTQQLTTAMPLLLLHIPGNGRKAWLSATWPGLIGVYSAMNEEGVVMLIHDSNGSGSRHVGLVPRSFGPRDAIERTGAGDKAIDELATILRSHTTFSGSNFHCAAPDGKGGMQAAVLEYDGQEKDEEGVTVRRSGDTGEKGDYIIATNHYCKRKSDKGMFPSTTKRYRELETAMNERAASNTRVKDGELASVLEGVEMDHGVVKTLHSVYIYPVKRTFGIAFADADSPAPREKRMSFNVPDMVKQASNN